MAWPKALPASGNFPGPKIINAIAKISINSPGPMLPNTASSLLSQQHRDIPCCPNLLLLFLANFTPWLCAPQLHLFGRWPQSTIRGYKRVAPIEFWSQGPVEGINNRLKLIKRLMHGRAKFDLLRKRVLHAQYLS